MRGDTETPVLIVGAGPVGTTMSLLLSRHGIRSILIDKRSRISDLPRARGVHARAMEILRVAGVEPDMRAAALPITPGAVWLPRLSAAPTRQLDLGSSRDDDVSPCEGLALSQDVFEAILAQHAAPSPHAEIRRGVELLHFDVDDNGVEATVVDIATGNPQRIRTRYLVAADGASSKIRGDLGIGMQGPDDLGRQRSVFFRADLSRWTGARPRGMYMMDEQAAVLIWTHPDDRWVVIFPDADTRGPLALVQAAVGSADIDVEILGTARWTGAAQHAERLSDGPVFLIGDAAHRFPPAGASGISTGMADAHNLAWKMALVLQGKSEAALLESYGEERLPVAKRNAAETLAMARQFTDPTATSEPTRTIRQLDMGYQYRSAVVQDSLTDSDAPGSDYRPTAQPGCRAPHHWLDGNTDGPSVIDMFDRSFVLLCGPANEPHWRDAVATSRPHNRIPLELQVINEPAWTELYAAESLDAVLVRPDGHVAWRLSPARCNGAGTDGEALSHALASASMMAESARSTIG